MSNLELKIDYSGLELEKNGFSDLQLGKIDNSDLRLGKIDLSNLEQEKSSYFVVDILGLCPNSYDYPSMYLKTKNNYLDTYISEIILTGTLKYYCAKFITTS